MHKIVILQKEKRTPVRTVTDKTAMYFIKIRVWKLWKHDCKSVNVCKILFLTHTPHVRKQQKLFSLPLCLIMLPWFDDAKKSQLLLKCLVLWIQQGLHCLMDFWVHLIPFWELRVCLESKLQQIISIASLSHFWWNQAVRIRNSQDNKNLSAVWNGILAF